MLKEILFLVFAVTTVAFAQSNVTCVKNAYPPDVTNPVPWYTVNLDLPPEERWKDVATGRQQQIRGLLAVFKGFIRDWGKVGTVLIDYVDKNMGNLDQQLPYPFAGELRGIAKYAGLNLGEVVLYNLIYEFSAFCTSIVAEDPKGNFVHARNLDFGIFMGWDIKNKTWELTEALRPSVINVDFQRGGQTVFQSVHFAGYVGILTGLKSGMFSFSMNARGGDRAAIIAGVLKWLEGDHTAQWMGFLTRSVMENATGYTEAQNKLAHTPMLVPAYFILGGSMSGLASVITRDRDDALDVWDMRSIQEHPWFVLETNYDHWKAPLFLDDRRDPGNQCMKEMGQENVGFAGVFDVLSTQPVLNKLTVYTSLMEVKTGKLETYIRYCKDPCFPW